MLAGYEEEDDVEAGPFDPSALFGGRGALAAWPGGGETLILYPLSYPQLCDTQHAGASLPAPIEVFRRCFTNRKPVHGVQTQTKSGTSQALSTSTHALVLSGMVYKA